MLKRISYVLLVLVALLTAGVTYASKTYAPAKVVYDVSTSHPEELQSIFDRASLLQRVYDNDTFEASIIIVIHEGAIPLFAKKHKKYAELMQRANSLTVGEIIQFRICSASARMQGFNTNDFYAFSQMVPMADAEIIELQNKGYAYLR